MRIKDYQSVFLVAGFILHLIYLYVEIKVIWYIGCVCAIISPFLPGGFWSIYCPKSAKGQEKKGNSMQGTENSTSSSIEKDYEQDNLTQS